MSRIAVLKRVMAWLLAGDPARGRVAKALSFTLTRH